MKFDETCPRDLVFPNIYIIKKLKQSDFIRNRLISDNVMLVQEKMGL